MPSNAEKKRETAIHTVALVEQAIQLAEKKIKLLRELRTAIIREHCPDDFPRPMGVSSLIPFPDDVRCMYYKDGKRCVRINLHKGEHRYA